MEADDRKLCITALPSSLQPADRFGQMGFVGLLRDGIRDCGFEKPSGIQRWAINPVLSGKHVIVQARSGAGKTSMIALCVCRLVDCDSKSVQVFVVSPTKEAAAKTAKIILDIGKHTKIRAHACVGLQDKDIRKLSRHTFHVACGDVDTMFNLLKGSDILDGIKLLVIDDVFCQDSDHWVESRFQDLVALIRTRASPQVIYTSAAVISPTLTSEINLMASSSDRIPVKILELTLMDNIKHYFKKVKEEEKFDTLIDLLQTLKVSKAVIFCNLEQTRLSSRYVSKTTKNGEKHTVLRFVRHGLLAKNKTLILPNKHFQELISVERLSKKLGSGISQFKNVLAMNRRMSMERKISLITRSFRSKAPSILVTTDISAILLDVEQVTLVLNFDLPTKTENYIQRTGRAGLIGCGSRKFENNMVLNFITPGDREKLEHIERYYDIQIVELSQEVRETLIAMEATPSVGPWHLLRISNIQEVNFSSLFETSDGVEPILSFGEMGIKENLLRGINACKIVKPSGVQQRALMPIIQGSDVMVQAQISSGKTCMISLAVCQIIDTAVNAVQVVILSGYMLHADATASIIQKIGECVNIKASVYTDLYGEEIFKEGILELQKGGVHVALGDVDTINFLIKEEKLPTKHVRLLVVYYDDGDSTLSENQVANVYKHLSPPDVQVVLISNCLLDSKIFDIINKNPVKILELTFKNFNYHRHIYVEEDTEKFEKVRMIYRELQDMYTKILIFCNTKRMVDILADHIRSGKLETDTDALSVYRRELEEMMGGTEVAKEIPQIPTVYTLDDQMSNLSRDSNMYNFKSETSAFLITTDIPALDFDVQSVSIVINYDMPNNAELYVRRLGRSGLFKKDKVSSGAINLVRKEDFPIARDVEQHYNIVMKKFSRIPKDVPPSWLS